LLIFSFIGYSARFLVIWARDWLLVCLDEWLGGWLVDLLVEWFVGLLLEHSAGCLVGWFLGYLPCLFVFGWLLFNYLFVS